MVSISARCLICKNVFTPKNTNKIECPEDKKHKIEVTLKIIEDPLKRINDGGSGRKKPG